MSLTRRKFIGSTLGSASLIGLSTGVPKFLLAAAAQGPARDGRVLVVVQLSGGNDGLNTVVPYTDDIYYKNRPTLAVGRGEILKIDQQLGFHPAMKGYADLVEAGKLSIVQGVGYPRPNRSHFESMDIWHTARIEKEGRPAGWIGRYLDRIGQDGRDVPALHLGPEKQPLALASHNAAAVSVQSLERFRLDAGGETSLKSTIEASTQAGRAGGDDLLTFVDQSSRAAIVSSRRVEEALGKYQSPVKYPASNLAGNLRSIAQLIDAGLSTRVYYVTLDGFDTHSTQGQAHAGLLGQLADATKAFVDDIAHHGHADRVLTVTFSEFGRRVKENASRGTDHGAAAPMFLAGGRVKPGLIGAFPNLTNLDDGDQIFHTDFRQVYATVLENWLGHESEPVLGGRFNALPLLNA